jgi:hypothetical protein
VYVVASSPSPAVSVTPWPGIAIPRAKTNAEATAPTLNARILVGLDILILLFVVGAK